MLGTLIDELKKRRERLRDHLEVCKVDEFPYQQGKVHMLKEILQLVQDAERKLHQED